MSNAETCKTGFKPLFIRLAQAVQTAKRIEKASHKNNRNQISAESCARLAAHQHALAPELGRVVELLGDYIGHGERWANDVLDERDVYGVDSLPLATLIDKAQLIGYTVAHEPGELA